MNYQNVVNYDVMFQGMPKRHPLNKELCLHYEPSYRGLSINVNEGPMIAQYMDALIETYYKQANQYARVFALRVDLYFPYEWSVQQRVACDYFSRFMDSLNAKLEAFKHRKRLEGKSRGNRVRFCRVYEQGNDGRGLHIHAVLFFNAHAFHVVGDKTSTSENIFHRINAAWASSLGLYSCQVIQSGLVEFSGTEHVIDNSSQNVEQLRSDMFEHLSYICKAYSKRFDLPVKVFSRSRG
jgi:hypothetical protein